MALRPAVSRLEQDWKTGQVLPLDMINPATRAFGKEVGFETTPLFVLFDAQGNELRCWQGRPPMLGELP